MLSRNDLFRGEPQKNRFNGLLPYDSRLSAPRKDAGLLRPLSKVKSGLRFSVTLVPDSVEGMTAKENPAAKSQPKPLPRKNAKSLVY